MDDEAPLEPWICITRPTITDGAVIGWRPVDWSPEDRGYSVSASRSGVLIGEIYLHQIPKWVLEAADKARRLLAQGELNKVFAMATHERIRVGKRWTLEPIPERDHEHGPSNTLATN